MTAWSVGAQRASEPEWDLDFEALESEIAATPTAPPPQDVLAGKEALTGLLDDARAPTERGDGVVPSITIDVFATRTDFLETARAISNDRRLAKTTMNAALGGAEAAIAAYKTRPSANLVILQFEGASNGLLRDLERLAELCDSNTRVVVVGSYNDIALYRELMRRGIDEYVVAPVPPISLARTISALYEDPETPFLGKSVAVIGAKGGVGASTIAHNLAWCTAERRGTATILGDFDLAFGTAALDFNQDIHQGSAEALLQPERLDRVVLERLLTQIGDKLWLLAAPAAIERDFAISQDGYEAVVDQMRRVAPFVVIDLPHVWGPWVRHALTSADEIVLVAAPDLASLRNTKNMLDFLKAVRANDREPSVVVNMVGAPKRPEIPVREFGASLGVEPVVVLPFDPHVFGTAANNGQSVVELAPTSRATQAFDVLVSHLTGRAAIEKPPAGLLAKLQTMIGKLTSR